MTQHVYFAAKTKYQRIQRVIENEMGGYNSVIIPDSTLPPDTEIIHVPLLNVVVAHHNQSLAIVGKDERAVKRAHSKLERMAVVKLSRIDTQLEHG